MRLMGVVALLLLTLTGCAKEALYTQESYVFGDRKSVV